MADLVVIEYNDMYTAEEVRLKLKKMQQFSLTHEQEEKLQAAISSVKSEVDA